MGYFVSVKKDPNARLDYAFDWAEEDPPGPWLEDGEIITASSWTAASGLTVDTSAFTDTETTVWLSGGTANTSYDVVNHITTNAGRQDDRTLRVNVVQR